MVAVWNLHHADSSAVNVLPGVPFINPASPSQTLAFLVLGATFVTTGTIWCLILAAGAARLRGFFVRNPTARRVVDRVTGSLFVVLGARLAWSR